MDNFDPTLHVGKDVVVPRRDLGVILDCELSMKKRIRKVISSLCVTFAFDAWKLCDACSVKRQQLLWPRHSPSLNYCYSILAKLAEIEHHVNATRETCRCSVNPCSWSMWRCVTHFGSLWSSASSSNWVRWCTSFETKSSISSWTCLVVPDTVLRSTRQHKTQTTHLNIETYFPFAGPAWNYLPPSLQEIRDHHAFYWHLEAEFFSCILRLFWYVLLVTYCLRGGAEKWKLELWILSIIMILY